MSGIRQHFEAQGHNIGIEGFKILDRGQSDFGLRVCESLYTRLLSPDLAGTASSVELITQ